MDPAQWKAPTMEEHDRIGITPAAEHVGTGPTPGIAQTFKSPNRALYTIPASPSRSNATARLNDELNEAGGSVPDYAAITGNPFQQPAREPSKFGSVAQEAIPFEVGERKSTL
jgi:hypothetical protein